MPIFHDKESYDRWLEEELPKRECDLEANPESALTHADILRAIVEWDSEERLLEAGVEPVLKRSA